MHGEEESTSRIQEPNPHTAKRLCHPAFRPNQNVVNSFQHKEGIAKAMKLMSYCCIVATSALSISCIREHTQNEISLCAGRWKVVIICQCMLQWMNMLKEGREGDGGTSKRLEACYEFQDNGIHLSLEHAECTPPVPKGQLHILGLQEGYDQHNRHSNAISPPLITTQTQSLLENLSVNDGLLCHFACHFAFLYIRTQMSM